MMSGKTEDWIIDAAEAIARHVERARSPAFQMTAEFKIEEAHSFGCAAVEAETERCVRKIAAFTKLSGSRKSELIAEICADEGEPNE